MLFSSVTFLLFFACVLAVHSLPLPWKLRKFNLLVASYVFYAAWDVRFTLLLVYATVTNLMSAKWIARWDSYPARRRLVLWMNVLLNIGVLCVFKYGNEFFEAWNWIARHVRLSYELHTLHVLLPVGLSFFTFQALSYTIDAYRRKLTPTDSVLDLALFVSFFPVLLAGPIMRAGNFLPQCAEPHRVSRQHLGMGAALVTLGLFMKITLADHLLLPVVRQVFDPNKQPDALTAWIGTIAFAAQDYCDFAGYTTCAVGLGLCLGFGLPDNFRAPFASVGFRDLWQRWHITLVAWMRDYVFLSLGGAYKGYLRAAVNVMIVFLLIGVWHGAAMTYVIFGLLHGTYLIGETILQRTSIRKLRLWAHPLGVFLMWFATMFLCCIAFVFYRSHSLPQACSMLRTLFGWGTSSYTSGLSDFEVFVSAVVVESVVIVHWLRRKMSVAEVIERTPWLIVAVSLSLMILAMTLTPGQSIDFLYFNF